MRKIAILAVALTLFLTGASIHMASAHKAQHTSKPNHVATAKPADSTPVAPLEVPTPDPGPVTVTVQPGDTLSGIADSYSTTYMRLYDANDFIANPDLIYPGDNVRVPSSDEQLADRAVPVAADPAPAPAPATDPAVNAAVEQTADPVADSVPVTDLAPVADPAPAPAPVAEAPAPAPQPAPAPEPAPAPVVTTGVADNAAKAFIYFHESSNNPNATNYLGCYGLGQDCSGQLRSLCGADWACQDRFFDNYAQARYGGWANAQAFWQAHNWW